MLNWGN